MMPKASTVAFALTILSVPGTFAGAAAKPEDLVKAAGKGNLAQVRQLLASGVSVNTQDKDGHTALLRAAAEGKTDVVAVLLEAGADPNLFDKDTKTPLWEAARHGQSDAVEQLLTHGARIDLPDKNGDTPLFQAARKDNDRAVELLLRADGDRARFKTDPRLLMAAAEGAGSAVLRQVLALGGDVDATDADGETALFRAARSGNARGIQALVEAKARVDRFSRLNLTPLMVAAQAARPDAVRALLRAGAPPDLRNLQDRGWTALMYAAAGTNSGVVDELAEGHADVNAMDDRHDLPIHIAARQANGSVVHALLVHGAEVDGLGSDHKTPLEIAVDRNDRDVAGQLVSGGAKVTPAMRDHAAKRKDEKMLAILGGT